IDRSGSIPWVRFRDRESYARNKTKEYDALAMRYFSYALYPLVAGCATTTYSLLLQRPPPKPSITLSLPSPRATLSLVAPSSPSGLFQIDRSGTIPWLRFRDRESYARNKTKEYDALAMRYFSYALYPLVAGYAVYSLIYETHKSWYSWVLNSLTGCVYTFGFIMMCPQLFINYKLKSVAHLPWRQMTYKFLHTIVDDLFAFVIKMPTLHRLSVFRDVHGSWMVCAVLSSLIANSLTLAGPLITSPPLFSCLLWSLWFALNHLLAYIQTTPFSSPAPSRLQTVSSSSSSTNAGYPIGKKPVNDPF
ncbi:unnamed protein product, partial [Closterium sp. NIES-53]